MPYVTRAQVLPKIPAPLLNEALDDDGDGTEDAGMMDSIISAASQAVDAIVACRFLVPFADPAPATIRESALAFVCEQVYDRRTIRGDGETNGNPWKDRADFWRKFLGQVAAGKQELDQATAAVPGALIADVPVVNGSMR